MGTTLGNMISEKPEFLSKFLWKGLNHRSGTVSGLFLFILFQLISNQEAPVLQVMTFFPSCCVDLIVALVLLLLSRPVLNLLYLISLLQSHTRSEHMNFVANVRQLCLSKL